MLDHKQLEVILSKKKLTEVNLILLYDHIDYIGEIQDTYGENLPVDVFTTLSNDLKSIIDFLEAIKENNNKIKDSIWVKKNLLKRYLN